MSFKKQELIAKKELVKTSRKLVKLKRETKLIRLSKQYHLWTGTAAKVNHTTMSKQLDSICKYYFKTNPEFKTRPEF